MRYSNDVHWPMGRCGLKLGCCKKRKRLQRFAEAFFFACGTAKQLLSRGSCLGSVFVLSVIDPVGDNRSHDGADVRSCSISFRLEGGVLGFGEDDPNLDFVACFAKGHFITPLLAES